MNFSEIITKIEFFFKFPEAGINDIAGLFEYLKLNIVYLASFFALVFVILHFLKLIVTILKKIFS
jgi:hypothetical protein